MRFEYHRAQDPRDRGLRLRSGKCLFIYKYYQHPTFGFMHTRLQTWLPFDVQVYMNGREWLAQQLRRAGADFERADNGFTALSDPALAQRLLDEQRRTAWAATLDGFLPSLNPLHAEIFARFPMSYWWVAYQTEWATDLLFQDADTLARLYPALVRHAIDHFKSPDVMRFWSRTVREQWKAEILTSFKERPEGVRVKHWFNGNSLKMYDKAGRLLRVEATMGNPKDFCVLRPRREDEGGHRLTKTEGEQLVWRNMRKSVADLHRRAEVSQRANERYLDALAVVDDPTPCARLFDAVSRPLHDHGRRFRALRLSDRDDITLLKTVARGEFVLTGFRNKDLRARMYANPKTKADERRLSARMSRLLRLLRAHGIIRKVQKTSRYHVTDRGRLLITALQATRNASLKQLLHAA